MTNLTELRSIRITQASTRSSMFGSLEVCAQVAADVVHTIVSREVHQLRAGRSGQPRIRRTDEAQAWRCALQVKSPSARRLHWWRIPGAAGSTIEFASADVHDEFGITE